MAYDETKLLLWSNVPGAVPTTSQMQLNGRIAINQADGKLFYRRSDNTIQSLNFGSSGNVSIDNVQGFGDLGKQIAQSQNDTALLTVLSVIIGVTAGKLVAVGSDGKLPALDGSKLQNLPSSEQSGIADGSLTNAKLANVPTQTFKARASANAGPPEDLTIAQVKTLLAYTIAELGGLALNAVVSAAEYRALTVNNKYISPASEASAVAFNNLGTLSGTVNLDMAAGFNQTITVGGNITLGQHTSVKDGAPIVVELIQGPGGNFTLARNTTYNKFPGGTVPTLSTAAGARDKLYGTQRVISGTSVIDWDGFVKGSA